MATVDRTKINAGPGRLYLKVPRPLTGSRLLIDANGVPSATAYAWAGTTAYLLGQEIVDSNGNLQLATTAGTSGSNAPTWATRAGQATTDGTVVWTCVALNAIQVAGASEGAVTTTLTPKIDQIMADQVDAPIDVIVTQEAAAIEVQLKESDLAKLANYIVHGTYATGTDSGLPANLQGFEEIAFGGVIPIPQFSVAVVSPRRDAVGKFIVSQLYQAWQGDAIALPFQRAKETMYKVKFEGLADPTRPVGDQVGKIYRQT
jgi:hypothetical protein